MIARPLGLLPALLLGARRQMSARPPQLLINRLMPAPTIE